MHVRTATDDELPLLAKAKLLEEAGEVVSSRPDDILGELADVLEAVRLVAHVYGYTDQDVEEARASKTETKGTFSTGIVGRFRTRHVSDHTKFCVLCLSGEHEDTSEDAAYREKRRDTIRIIMERVVSGMADSDETRCLQSLVNREIGESDTMRTVASTNLQHVRTLITDVLRMEKEKKND